VLVSEKVLARRADEGDRETTTRKNDRAKRETDEISGCHRYSIFGTHGAIVVPLADASG
jgi:hypothetical protein